ncbi:MAG: acetolactate synthase small subunit [Candidatus Aenigmarchaeota archaeon]|nr:acetolactate synthase small subunit [Candidatus Aenigmarchaeota archaeon]
MKTYIISILVADEPGVLSKLSGLFLRRGFNIDTIAVGSTEKKGFSRIIISLHCDEKTIYQLEKQLTKSLDVVGVSDLSEKTILRELCLIKLKTETEEQKEQIKKELNHFGAKIIDTNKDYIIVQITDTPDKIKQLIDVLSDCKIVKITRSGTIAIKDTKNNNSV